MYLGNISLINQLPFSLIEEEIVFQLGFFDEIAHRVTIIHYLPFAYLSPAMLLDGLSLSALWTSSSLR